MVINHNGSLLTREFRGISFGANKRFLMSRFPWLNASTFATSMEAVAIIRDDRTYVRVLNHKNENRTVVLTGVQVSA